MNKEIVSKHLNELIDSFDLMPLDATLNSKFKNVIQRNFTISLYSIWETYIKTSLYDIYTTNEDVLYDEDFIKRYFEKIFSKKYINKMFLKNISNSDIQKEILFDSNNLNWYELEKFMSLLDFNINILKMNLIDNSELNKIILVLEDRGLTPLYTEKNKENDLQMKRIVGYIQLIVENRNQISHSFNPYLTDYLDKRKASVLIHFLKVLIKEIDSFINEQIAEKVKQKGHLEEVLKILDVIKGCNADINQTCIVTVNIPNDFKGFPDEIFIYSETGNVEKGEILGMRYKNLKISKIIYDKPIALEIKVPMKIKNRRNYYIYARKIASEKMKIIHTVYDENNLSSYLDLAST
ncbi:hypothetical protein SFC55_03160 [Niallia taxi]|uniref:hypothetical protein n=1 Tax=Niallia taxi TaxID=2499688 RepID=UPI003981AD1E